MVLKRMSDFLPCLWQLLTIWVNHIFFCFIEFSLLAKFLPKTTKKGYLFAEFFLRERALSKRKGTGPRTGTWVFRLVIWRLLEISTVFCDSLGLPSSASSHDWKEGSCGGLWELFLSWCGPGSGTVHLWLTLGSWRCRWECTYKVKRCVQDLILSNDYLFLHIYNSVYVATLGACDLVWWGMT